MLRYKEGGVNLQTVTKIQQQKKRKNRYNIFLNEVYTFGVDEDVLVKYHIKKGMELTPEEIEEITSEEDFHSTYVMAINYLSYRMRTKKEIRTYLQEKETPTKMTYDIIEKLEKEQLLDDVAFAEAFVRDRMNQTSKGPRIIVKELQEKGVERDIASEAVLQYSEEFQFTKAYKWAQVEAKKKSAHAAEKQKDQLKNKLIQKGFASDVVLQVMNEIEIDVDETEEYAKLEKQANTLLRRYEKKHEGYELKMKLKAALYQRRFSRELIDEYIDKIETSR